jgi:hypothetical protein
MATVTTPVRIGPADNGRRMTLQEFFKAEEAQGYCYELARGALECDSGAERSPEPGPARPRPPGLGLWSAIEEDEAETDAEDQAP